MQQARGFPHKSFSASLPQPSNGSHLSMESPSGIQKHNCIFLSLTLPLSPTQVLKVQCSPPHLTPPMLSHPLQSHLCRLTRRIFPHTTTIPYECTLESHHLKDTLASQVPQKLVSQMCEILPPAPSTPLSHPPALQVGSSCLLLYFYTEGSEPSNSDVYLEVKDERLVLCLWSH